MHLTIFTLKPQSFVQLHIKNTWPANWQLQLQLAASKCHGEFDEWQRIRYAVNGNGTTRW